MSTRNGASTSTDPQPDYLTCQQVADVLSVKRTTITEQLSRGAFPEPDLILLRHPLWLRETIEQYIKDKPKRMRNSRRRRRGRTPRSARIKQPSTTQPPRHANLSGLRAKPKDLPESSSVSEQIAKQIATALRQSGQHCTTADVIELADADPDSLSYERQQLQQRVQAKLRGLKRQAI